MNPIRSLSLAISFACALPFPLSAHEPHPHGAEAIDVAALVNQADALMQRSRDRLDPALYAPAEDLYRRALAADPQNAGAMLGLAWVHNSEHEFAEGRRWAEAALAIDPTIPDAFALIGDGAAELGDYEEAFAQYQKALDLRPDQSSYSRAAQLLWLTGDIESARFLLLKAIAAGSSAPENTAWCRARLALMYFHAGELVSADSVLTEALRDNPNNAHLLIASGRLQAARGSLEGAIDSIKRSVEIAPSHEALAILVDLYTAAGRDSDARSQFDAVMAFHGAHNHGHDDHAHVHTAPHASHELALFLADHDRDLGVALSSAEADYAAFPNVFAADALAWCQFKAGRYEAAAVTINEALRLGTPIADIHFHAGMIFAKLGDATRAREHLSRALDLNPSFHPRFARVAADELARIRSKPRI